MTDWILGVDLGTSFSCGAFGTADEIGVLPIQGEARIPSTVVLAPDGSLIAGFPASRVMMARPEYAERNPKRYVGRSAMILGGTRVDPIEALAATLKLFVDAGSARFDGALPAQVMLTYPASWGQDRIEVLNKTAGKALPGVHATLTPEPVAAAVHFAAQRDLAEGETVAVYDLGGGTFDVAVLTRHQGEFTVSGRPGGDDSIGGESFDQKVMGMFGDQISLAAPQWWEQLQSGTQRRWLVAAADLLNSSRDAKEALSSYGAHSEYISGADVDVEISRAQFDELIRPDVQRTVDLLAQSLVSSGLEPGVDSSASGLHPGKLRGIFMSGGASRTPLVAQLLRERYGELIHTWGDPKAVVALGAVQLAASRTDGLHPPPPPIPAPTPPPAPPAPDTNPNGTGKAGPAGPPGPIGGGQTTDGTTGGTTGGATGGTAEQAVAPQNGPRSIGDFTGMLAEARPGRSHIFGWAIEAAGPQAGHHRLLRINPAGGGVDRWLPIGALVDWAVAPDGGLLVIDRQAQTLRLLVLSPQLTIRLSFLLDAQSSPRVHATGQHGWVVTQVRQPYRVSSADNLPWGEIGDVEILVVDLQATTPQGVRTTGRRQNASWHLNEDGVSRRIIDQGGPSGTVPFVLDGDEALGISLGRIEPEPGPLGALSPRRVRKMSQFMPSQEVLHISAEGVVRSINHTTAPWIHQVAQVRQAGRAQWLTVTSEGAGLGPPEQSRLVHRRTPSGVVRWLVAGSSAYCLSLDEVLPMRGLRVLALDGQSVRPVLTDAAAALLGHPASTHRMEVLRWAADGEGLLLPITVNGQSTRLLRVSDTGTRLITEVRGWLEPIMRSGDDIICLHSPDSPPGARRSRPAWPVRIHYPVAETATQRPV